MNNEEVFVVMAIERNQTEFLRAEGPTPTDGHKCYCVCDSMRTARQVIDNDIARGDIYPGAIIESHVLQTKELI